MLFLIKAYLKEKKEIFDLVRESAFSFLLKIFGIFLSYLLVVLVSNKFGAEGLGIFTLMTTISLIFTNIFKFGFDTALLKITAELNSLNQKASIKSVYYIVLKVILPATILITFLLITFSGEIADKIFNKPNLEISLFACGLIVVPYVLILIHAEGLRGFNKINEYVFLQNVGTYFFTIGFVLVYTYFFKGDSNTPMYIYVGSLYTILLISFILWYKQLPEEQSPSPYSINTISKIALPMWLSSAMMTIIGWADTILLGIFSTEEEVGIYSVALKTANLILLSQATINNIVAPKIAALYAQGKVAELKKIISKFSIIIFITSLPVYLTLICFPELILSIFGKEFIPGKNILIILATSQFLNSIFGSADIFLQMVGKEKVFRNFITIATILNIAVNFYVIPIYGVYGAALTALGSILAWKGVAVIYINSKFGINMLPGFKL